MATDDWNIIGHTWAVRMLQRSLATGSVSHAYLFTGPEGVSKGTLALTLAQALLCQGDAPPCGACRSCRLVTSGNHPDLHIVEVGVGDSLKVEQVRDLERALSLTPSEGGRRVAILRHFERATPSAANALLKTLEEPPDYAVLVVLADDAEHLLPTIVSRCQQVALRPIPVTTLEQLLIARRGLPPERARLLAHLSGGRPGWALRAAADDSLLRRRTEQLDALMHLLRASVVERFGYAEKLAGGDRAALRETLDWWQSWWRDVMLLAARADAVLTNVDRRDELAAYAARFGAERSAAMVQAVAETARFLESNVNPRLAVESLVLNLPRR